MKKILIIATGFEGAGGGKVCAIIENFLSKYYETVTLVLFEDKGVFDIKGKKINVGALFNSGFPGRGYIESIWHIYYTIKYIKKEKPDIVIGGTGTYSNFLLLIANIFLKFKLLLTQHEHISSQKSTISFFNLYNLAFFIIKRLIGENKIVCVSNGVKLDTIKQYKIKENQAQTIYNGLDFDEIKRLGNVKIDIQGKYIINVGRLNDGKNQKLLIKAYAKSKIKNKYKLLLLGEGNNEQYLKRLCKELDVENFVIFSGFDKNPYKYLKNASLFCFTSKTEALPTVLIESLILNIPIISVPVTGADEVLKNGKFGVITKDYNEQNLIKELDVFVEGQINNSNSEKLKFLNEIFSIEAMERKYLDIINNL